VHYGSERLPVRAVDGVTFRLERGETYALVGESGSGKTATGLALLRLVEPGRIAGGRMIFEGRDLLSLSEKEMRRVRGGRIGMVFQEPATALDPVMRVGHQVAEALRAHRKLTRREVAEEVERLLGVVALPEPARQARAYPHELSGGMIQRVMLAIALACAPALLVADEPTTALDVTIQAQILALLRRLKREFSLTVLLITHDLRVVAETADRVGVMYAGRLVEEAPAPAFFDGPLHPYAQALLRSVAGTGQSLANGRLPTLPGTVPDPACPPAGCRFHPRCAARFAPCDQREPALLASGSDRRVACFLHSDAGEAAP